MRGISWEVPAELLESSGAEDFVAKLHNGSGEEPILDRDFSLDIPDEKD